jgi:hypothetical protein
MMMDSEWHKAESAGAGDTDMHGHERQEGAHGVLCPLIPHDQCTAQCRSCLLITEQRED